MAGEDLSRTLGISCHLDHLDRDLSRRATLDRSRRLALETLGSICPLGLERSPSACLRPHSTLVMGALLQPWVAKSIVRIKSSPRCSSGLPASSWCGSSLRDHLATEDSLPFFFVMAWGRWIRLCPNDGGYALCLSRGDNKNVCGGGGLSTRLECHYHNSYSESESPPPSPGA